MWKKIISKEPILVASFILFIISIIFVPIDREYMGYIHFKTLGTLLCLMIPLKGMEKENLLDFIAMKIIAKTSTLKGLIFILVFGCFFAAMFMTNDVALIAIVPITLVLLKSCALEQYASLIVVLQTLAANLGSSLTPIGNPQNLYLFIHYKLALPTFLMTMLPFVLFSAFFLAVTCLFFPKVKIHKAISPNSQNLDCKNSNCIESQAYFCSMENPIKTGLLNKKLVAYIIMFFIALCTVFDFIPYGISLSIIIISCLFVEKQVVKEVDYSLLLTFIVIFMLVGNLARIESINEIISELIDKNTFLTAVFTSQFISNVPTALMLSEFTENINDLLIGVNVGGMGTLIASMASVISFKLYTQNYKKNTLIYLLQFTLFNVIFLGLSVGFYYLI